MAFRGFSVGIFTKLLVSFLVLSVIPLMVLGYMASMNLADTGRQAMSIAREVGETNLEYARRIGIRAIEDSVWELDKKSTEAIEVRTVELAARIADFLYERDRDALLMAAMPPSEDKYLEAYRFFKKEVILPEGPDGLDRSRRSFMWQNPENRVSWRNRPPNGFNTKVRPLYKEIAFVDLSGKERIKIADGVVSNDLKDVSRIENTFCKAEDYFESLGALGKGEIYVSRVIGPYVPGWLYMTEEGIRVRPESAYAGKENPSGKRFEGIIRWATPVYEDGTKVGYVTLALDHTHVMEFTDHVVPTEERFSDISDAGSGNYAFLWDDQDQCISHPRDFFICGYDPETGREVPGWLSQETYDRYKQSGLSLEQFVETLPPFEDYSQRKKGAKEQIDGGSVGLDCQILDHAPQCQGWHRGSEGGGSGSFLILWSGLWKLTTYAAVPYHTGIYGESPRGFGYVTIGAHVEDFHKAANVTKASIEENIRTQESNIMLANRKASAVMKENTAKNRNILILITAGAVFAVFVASVVLGVTIVGPLKRLTQGAAAMSRGEYDQHIEVRAGDEIGRLAESFNQMAAAVKEIDNMKSEFVTIASHELRTPIHAMLLGVSGVLAGYSGEISDEVREDLEVVNEGIVRITALVESLLDLSRMEARKIEFEFAQVSLGPLVEKAITETSELIRVAGHRVETDVASDLPEISGDPKRLVQVIVNLLSNSIKYTPSGGMIFVRVVRKIDEVVLMVADNGYGIPEWASRKVFEKFFQADSITSSRVGGSGLGLTITEGIVKAHGGRIYCQSPPEEGLFSGLVSEGERKGTVFYVHLPIENKNFAL